MKTSFATTWNKSVQRRKQRKYNYNAPYHTKGKFMAAHLSEELRKKHGTRSARVKKGDKVKILRGNSKGKEGKVERVDVQRAKVYVTKVERSKNEGANVQLGLHPSSLVITELDMSDKKRKAKLEGAKKE